MQVQELPIVFDCEGSQLIGMLHLPAQVQARGMIALVAGGPQYRGGVGRMQVQMARTLAAGGVPVMRFDHRGLGDSDGSFRGFEDVEADLGAAIAAFRQHVPQVRELVLWGGCDAAAALFINGWKYPEVTGLVAGNPWVHSEATADAAVVRHHYAQRIREKSFWLKVLRFDYNPLEALGVLGRMLLRKLLPQRGAQAAAQAAAQADQVGQPFVQRMCRGLARYRGDLLLLMSGRSIVSKEFDELVASSPAWQQALKQPRQLTRLDFPEADQTFSAIAVREQLNAALLQWMRNPSATPGAASGQRAPAA